MKLVVYADESGTHDETGEKPGASEATLAGLLAPAEDWSIFRREWQSTLAKYGAAYFHFSEWYNALALVNKSRPVPSSFIKKNPYKGWDEARLRQFVIELAKIAGGGNRTPVGGCVYTKKFHTAKQKGDTSYDGNPYRGVLYEFFYSIQECIGLQRKPWKNMPISFVFDQTDSTQWRADILDVFSKFKKDFPKYSEPIFGDKKLYEFLPLQAADMIAHRQRIITNKFINLDATGQWKEFDDALYKNSYAYFSRVGIGGLAELIKAGKLR